MASPHVTAHVVGFAQVTAGIAVRVVLHVQAVPDVQDVLVVEAATTDAIVDAPVARDVLAALAVEDAIMDAVEAVPAVVLEDVLEAVLEAVQAVPALAPQIARIIHLLRALVAEQDVARAAVRFAVHLVEECVVQLLDFNRLIKARTL